MYKFLSFFVIFLLGLCPNPIYAQTANEVTSSQPTPLAIHVLSAADHNNPSPNNPASNNPSTAEEDQTTAPVSGPQPVIMLGEGLHAQVAAPAPAVTVHWTATVERFFARFTLSWRGLTRNTTASSTRAGWDEDFYATGFENGLTDNFSDNFSGDTGGCTWHRPLLSAQPLGWGIAADRARDGQYALWPVGEWLAPAINLPVLPGANYPDSVVAEAICELSAMKEADNLLIQFDLWHTLADPGDRLSLLFFTGEYTEAGEPVYRGVSWQGVADETVVHDWKTYRIYYPDLGGSNVVRVKLRFESDSQGTAAGPWIDNLALKRYDQPASSDNCVALDPTMRVPGTPGNRRVSKGLTLPAYAKDDVVERVQRLKAAGVHWVRLEFAMPPVETGFTRADVPLSTSSHTHIDLQHYDALIDELCANGIAVLGLIDYQTVLSRDWQDETLSDDFITAFTAVADQLARVYSDRIGHWEVWNEPDFLGTRLSPPDYARLLTATYESIKIANPTARVLFGGLGSADNAALNYLEAVYAHLPTPSPFDILAIHPYFSVEYDPGNLKLKPAAYLLRNEIGAPTIIHKFLAEMAQHGDGNKAVWVTELGWNSAIDSPLSANCPAINNQLVDHEQQAAFLQESFDILFKQTAWDWLNPELALQISESSTAESSTSGPSLTVPSITKIFWFQYRDTGIQIDCNRTQSRMSASEQAQSGARELEVVDWWYGLFDGNFQPKAAHDAFRCYPHAVSGAGCVHGVFLPTIQK